MPFLLSPWLTIVRADYASKPMALPEIDHVIFFAARAYTFFASEKYKERPKFGYTHEAKFE